MKSWQTTIGGILLFVSIVSAEAYKAFDGKPETEPSIGMIIAAFGGLGIGVSARDNSVTSEQAGAKR